MTSTQWFASWFDSVHYHRLYAHRDHAEAAARGFDVTGLDLAAASIEAARASEGPRLRFRRHDMRVPFGRAAFDYVFSFFTSFGYFDDPAEQLTVVRNMARALKPGGRLVLDYLNVRYAEEHLTPQDVVEIDGVVYQIRRWTDGCRFFKRIVVHDGRDGAPLEYREQVARFSLADFERMFAFYGLEIGELYGDYRLGAYDARTSPRLVLIAGKRSDDGDRGYLRDRFLRTRLMVSGETPR